jgi:hypothetical protein
MSFVLLEDKLRLPEETIGHAQVTAKKRTHFIEINRI